MRKLTIAAAVAAASIPNIANAAELVANGGFETGSFSSWTLTNGEPGGNGVDSAAARTGTAGAYFGNLDSLATLSQTLSSVAAGTSLTVSFWLRADDDSGVTPDNDFVAMIQGTTLLTLTNADNFLYRQYSYSYVATAAPLVLSFSARNAPIYYSLDDVSVTTNAVAGVPEPATWLMLILGFGAIGYSVRRQKTVAKVRFA